jgi:hypothetical protein
MGEVNQYGILIRSAAMDLSPSDFGKRSRLRALLDHHFAIIEDKREPIAWVTRWPSFCF